MTNPTTNTALVADCESLLGLRDDNFTSSGTAAGHTRREYEAIAERIYESIWERPD